MPNILVVGPEQATRKITFTTQKLQRVKVIFEYQSEAHIRDAVNALQLNHPASVLDLARRCQLSRDCPKPSVPGIRVWGQRDFSERMKSLGSLLTVLSSVEFFFWAQAMTHLRCRQPSILYTNWKITVYTHQRKSGAVQGSTRGHFEYLIRA